MDFIVKSLAMIMFGAFISCLYDNTLRIQKLEKIVSSYSLYLDNKA